jgi:hypothetical protein
LACREFATLGPFQLDEDNPTAWEQHQTIGHTCKPRHAEFPTHAAERFDASNQGVFNDFFEVVTHRAVVIVERSAS